MTRREKRGDGERRVVPFKKGNPVAVVLKGLDMETTQGTTGR